MKKASIFLLHVVVAIPGAIVVGEIMLVGLGLGHSRNPWLDFPYSPFFWGSAALLGLLINRLKPSPSGYWVWIVGVLWFALGAVSTLSSYDPRWCNGCSRLQYFWYAYFDYSNPVEEGIGQMIGTTPLLNSIAYSIGALLTRRVALNSTAGI